MKIGIYSLVLIACAGLLQARDALEPVVQLRLENHINTLWDLHEEYGGSYPTFYYYDDYYEQDEWGTFRSFFSYGILRPPFNHELVVWCAKKIGKKQSLEPLFQAWDEFSRYRGIDPIDDEFFLRECAYLVLLIYNNILRELEVEEEDEYRSYRFDLNEMRDLYIKIASLPLGKLIDILDKIAIGLISAIAMHATPAANPGIFAWVKQNWWIPPTVIAGVVTAIILRDGKMSEVSGLALKDVL